MSGNQRFTCGMRRFDKHRMESNSVSHSTNPTLQKEIQQRLQAREEQDCALYSTSIVPNASISSNTYSSSTLSGPSVLSEPLHYTPWKTPSATS